MDDIITEDYVSFETAKLLKEKGFESELKTWWDDNGIMNTASDEYPHLSNYDGEYWMKDMGFVCIAPTIHQALKFIRKKYNYHIIVTPEYGDVEYMPGQWQEEFLGWKYTIIAIDGSIKNIIVHPVIYAKDPETAYEQGIKFFLHKG